MSNTTECTLLMPVAEEHIDFCNITVAYHSYDFYLLQHITIMMKVIEQVIGYLIHTTQQVIFSNI